MMSNQQIIPSTKIWNRKRFLCNVQVEIDLDFRVESSKLVENSGRLMKNNTKTHDSRIDQKCTTYSFGEFSLKTYLFVM